MGLHKNLSTLAALYTSLSATMVNAALSDPESNDVEHVTLVANTSTNDDPANLLTGAWISVSELTVDVFDPEQTTFAPSSFTPDTTLSCRNDQIVYPGEAMQDGAHYAGIIGESGDIVWSHTQEAPYADFPNYYPLKTPYMTEQVFFLFDPAGEDGLIPGDFKVRIIAHRTTPENTEEPGARAGTVLFNGINNILENEKAELEARYNEERNSQSYRTAVAKGIKNPAPENFSVKNAAWHFQAFAPIVKDDDGTIKFYTYKNNYVQALDPMDLSKHPVGLSNINITEGPDGIALITADGHITHSQPDNQSAAFILFQMAAPAGEKVKSPKRSVKTKLEYFDVRYEGSDKMPYGLDMPILHTPGL